MKKLILAGTLAVSFAATQNADAVDFNVEITNLSNGIHYTPFLVAAHPDGTSLFTTGQPASANLQAMAEGGDIAGLSADLQGLGATIAENPAGGGEGFNAARSDRVDQVAMHTGVVSQDDGFATSGLTGQHRFDNPVTDIRIERTD